MDGLLSTVLRQPQAGGLPARRRRKEVAVRGAAMAGGRESAAAAKQIREQAQQIYELKGNLKAADGIDTSLCEEIDRLRAELAALKAATSTSTEMTALKDENARLRGHIEAALINLAHSGQYSRSSAKRELNAAIKGST